MTLVTVRARGVIVITTIFASFHRREDMGGNRSRVIIIGSRIFVCASAPIRHLFVLGGVASALGRALSI